MASETAIITSLCWVSRGYASAIVEEYEPTKQEIEQYKQIGQTLAEYFCTLILRGDMEMQDYDKLTKEIENNLNDMDLDKYEEEDGKLEF